MSSVEIVRFHEDQIEAIRGEDGRGYVTVRRMCENLGVGFSVQLRKLKKAHWTTVVMMTTVGLDGQAREMTVMPYDHIPFWLTTIDARKVSESVRAKIKQYQLSARDVLAAHFLGQTKPQIDELQDDSDDDSMESSLAMAKRSHQVMAAMISTMEKTQRELRQIKADNLRTQSLVQQVQSQLMHQGERIEAVAGPIEAGRKQLEESPSSPIPAAPLTTRMKINLRVQSWCKAHGGGRLFKDMWGKIYDHFRRRYSIDVVRRQKNDPEKYPQYLDVVDEMGRLDDLFALVCELCPTTDLATVA